MSPSRILLFIVSVFAIITGLSFAVRDDGFKLGGVTVDFPTTEEILAQIMPSRDASLSPEQLIALREAALMDAERGRFERFVTSDPGRFYFPDADVTLFDKFFRALDEASENPVRIIHYGDSQLEEDRITGTLRDSLQKKFGGLGPGLLPLDKYYTRAISEISSTVPEKYSVFGFVGSTRKDGLYGPMGLMSSLDSSMTVTILPSKSYKGVAGKFSRLSLLVGRTHGNVTIRCAGSTRKMGADSITRSIRWEQFDIPDSSSRVQLSVSAGAEVYGLVLDGKTGVSVDNVPMRGCGGEVFTRIEKNHLSDYFSRTWVRMIILQFGGNAMPSVSGSSSISSYCTTIRKQIKHLHSIAPDAAILFIGPSDMSKNIRGTMQTYPLLSEMVDSLKAAANDSGAAYWDMYEVMGGNGSMSRWVKSTPALAGSDHVHFTRKGAERMGDLLYGTFKLYYDYYRFRNDR